MKKFFDLEIVSHCYALSRPFYLTHLKFQLGSLFHFSPDSLKVRMSVVTATTDRATVDYLGKAAARMPAWIYLQPLILTPAAVFRRAVGRNLRALDGAAARYWFTDVDYLFGKGCIQSLVDLTDESTGLVYPEHVWINPEHSVGDELVQLADESGKMFPSFEKRCFKKREQKRCIGGVHIIGSNALQAVDPTTGMRAGYINNHKKCNPVPDPENGFRQCRCDVPFKSAHGPATQIPIKNVFRIRHTTAGRMYDADGSRLEPMKGDHD